MNFWDAHGILFVICMMIFPRLTMLFGAAVTSSFGPLGWLGWVFAPRLTVAIIATGIYWNTNPALIVITWIWVLGGESTEKSTIVNQSKS